MERTILHCDMNNFYASVECMLDMSLKGKAVAVGGDVENRHGIILAKNYEAKKYGVQTGEALWQARQKCRNLVIVPPHYEQYIKYSKLARQIYAEYTDLVEPYGMDECWLDVSGSIGIYGDGEKIANEIRERMKFELGLTISAGVSFNKIFAKLGSDMKKPDAVTVISKDSFREQIWQLPASDLLGVGRATQKVLTLYGIKTIGDLANASPDLIERRLGKCGLMCIRYAKGEDISRVMPTDFEPPVKSVGHGITAKQDLENPAEVWNIMLSLTQDIGHKLRVYGKRAGGVQIDIRNNQLRHKQWQCRLSNRTNSSAIIAKTAFELFVKNYKWEYPIRSVTVRAINLHSAIEAEQLDFFGNAEETAKRERLETAIEKIRDRFGKHSIQPATLYRDIKMPNDREVELTMPTGLTASGKHSKYALTEVLKCGECGSKYRRCTWTSHGKKRIVWRCINRLDNGTKYCSDSVTVLESSLHQAIVRALKQFDAEDEVTYLTLMKATIGEAIGLNGGTDEIDLLQRKIDALNKRMITLATESVQNNTSFEENEAEYKDISEQIEQLGSRINAITESLARDNSRKDRLQRIQEIIAQRRIDSDTYDDAIVRQMIECIEVFKDGTLLIHFGGGYEIEEHI